MAIFADWLVNRDTSTLLRLRLLEAAEFFDPKSYNPVFNGELEKLLARIHDNDLRRQVERLKGFDWGNYVSRSLLRAGLRDDDQQEAFHQIVVKLLVEPGRLFRGWEPQKHGPLEQRFKRSVWNAIRNITEKTRNRRRWMTAVDPNVMADRYAGRQPYSDLIDRFRQLVAQRLGKLALEILDARLAGEDSKNLVGKAANGTASAYYIKVEIRAIKELAQQFAQQTGDQVFLHNLAKAMDSEKETVAKRQAARQAQ
jgi:hypothetical protein